MQLKGKESVYHPFPRHRPSTTENGSLLSSELYIVPRIYVYIPLYMYIVHLSIPLLLSVSLRDSIGSSKEEKKKKSKIQEAEEEELR